MRFFYLNTKTYLKRVLLIILIMTGLLSGFVLGQEKNPKVVAEVSEIKSSQDIFSLKESVDIAEYKESEFESWQTTEIIDDDSTGDYKFFEFSKPEEKSPQQTFLKPEFREFTEKRKEPLEKFPDDIPEQFDTSKQSNTVEKFHWKPALIQSFYLLSIQHGVRLFQKKTIREFEGKFFPDWGNSVKNLGGWRDGDSFSTNYIAHPAQGAITGRIFINNSDKSKKLEFSNTKEYWESRFKAMAWSAVWSTQFELGPYSEATIGNVGLYDKVGPNRLGWVDMVITPTAGTGFLIGEDIIDKYILKKWLERKLTSRTKIKFYRTFITPFQSFTNILSGKKPWSRYNR